jgi:alkylation response protein AidB-like acyl-CoA dehydrogenase
MTVITADPHIPTSGRADRLRGQLEATTEAGQELVSYVESLVPVFTTRALRDDREGTYPYDSLGELRAAGFLRAPVPLELGGLGVETLHDLVVASSRLARADASLAIGVNMHLVALHAAVRSWRGVLSTGDELKAKRLGDRLSLLARSGVAIAAAISEPPPQDLSRPATTATRVEDGWRIDGVKAFCTMSPAADLFGVGVTFGDHRYGFATVPASAPGVTVHDDWDALGMRASGSGRVTFDGVLVGPHDVADSHPAGVTSVPGLDRFLSSGLFHASATLGIAEAAHRIALDGRDPDAARIAENAVDLHAMRAGLAVAATAADRHYAEGRDHTLEEALDVFASVQSAKAFVDVAGPRVVDRAIALSGGGGYLSKSPLSKAYRDVRAGAFMHPLGANRAYDFVGAVELGRVPELR